MLTPAERDREIQELASEFMDQLGYPLGAALQLAQQCLPGLLAEGAARDVEAALAKVRKERTDERREQGA